MGANEKEEEKKKGRKDGCRRHSKKEGRMREMFFCKIFFFIMFTYVHICMCR